MPLMALTTISFCLLISVSSLTDSENDILKNKIVNLLSVQFISFHKIILSCLIFTHFKSTTYGTSTGKMSAMILIESLLALEVGDAANNIFNKAIIC